METTAVLDTTPLSKPKPDYSLGAALHAAGMRYDQIAKEIGAPSPDAVRKRLARQKMAVLRPAAFTGAIRAGLAAASRSTRHRLAAALEQQIDVIEANPAKNLKALANTKQRQGIAAVTKTIAETAATVFDWGSDKPQGIIVMSEAMPEPGQAIEVEAEKKEITLQTGDGGRGEGEAPLPEPPLSQ